MLKVKKRVEKRPAYLYSGELVSIIVFVFVSYLLNRTYPGLHLFSLYSFWVSFLLLEFFLLQGTVYWYTKLKRLKTENTSVTPLQIVRLLWQLKKLNIVLIVVTIIAFVFDFIRWYPSLPIGGLIIAGIIYVFAVLEYINYFYVQLSYDNISDLKYLLKTRKLKQATIGKDFKRIL